MSGQTRMLGTARLAMDDLKDTGLVLAYFVNCPSISIFHRK